jgi:thioredoxin-related protein
MMKKLILLLVLIAPVFILNAQEGIQFAEGSWQEVLQKAKDENKIIFLDAYTTWCGPCKLMSRDVFTDEKVGKFYNTRFINMKMDMEKGEGIELAKNFNVKAYPSLLFVNGEGELVHRKAGYHDPEQFLELGRTALNPIIRLGGMEKRYAEGDRDPDFLYALALVKLEAMDGTHGEIAEAYLATQEDWSTEQNMQFIFSFVEDTDSKMFDYLVENREAFENAFGMPTVFGKLQSLMMNKAFSEHGDERLALQKMDQLFEKVFKDDAAQLSASFRVNYFQYKNDIESYSKAAVDYFKKYPSDNATELNNTAWAFYESVDDKAMLNEALKWAIKSVEIDSQYYNNDTVAALYYKLGKKGKAKKAAKEAISIAKKNGEDYSSTEELLNKIQGKK